MLEVPRLTHLCCVGDNTSLCRVFRVCLCGVSGVCLGGVLSVCLRRVCGLGRVGAHARCRRRLVDSTASIMAALAVRRLRAGLRGARCVRARVCGVQLRLVVSEARRADTRDVMLRLVVGSLRLVVPAARLADACEVVLLRRDLHRLGQRRLASRVASAVVSPGVVV